MSFLCLLFHADIDCCQFLLEHDWNPALATVVGLPTCRAIAATNRVEREDVSPVLLDEPASDSILVTGQLVFWLLLLAAAALALVSMARTSVFSQKVFSSECRLGSGVSEHGYCLQRTVGFISLCEPALGRNKWLSHDYTCCIFRSDWRKPISCLLDNVILLADHCQILLDLIQFLEHRPDFQVAAAGLPCFKPQLLPYQLVLVPRADWFPLG